MAQRFLRLVGVVVLLPFVRLRVENAPDFYTLGPVILAPNHASFLDPPILQMAIRHHLTFMMTATIYRVRLFRWLFRIWGAIPVQDSGAAAAALREAQKIVATGRPVVLFPEGRISDDGCLNEGRGGIAMLMMRTGVPVLPVAILGTHHVLPRHRRWPRRGIVRIRFGDLIPAPEANTDPRGFVGRIMGELAALGVPTRPSGDAVEAVS